MASDSSHLFHKVHPSKINSHMQNEQFRESTAKLNCKWTNMYYIKNCWVHFRSVKIQEVLLNATLVSYPAELEFHLYIYIFFIPFLAVKNVFNVKELISDKSRQHPCLNDKTIENYCGGKKRRKLIFSC